MVTHSRKPDEAYFASIIDRIEYKVRVNERTGQVFFFALVPSTTSDDRYLVKLDKNENATWCECLGHWYRRDDDCRHMQAVNRKKAIADAETVAVANDKSFEQATTDFIVNLDTFYATRGEEITAKINDAPCSLNGTRVSSVAATGATKIEEGLASRHLLR